MGPARTKIELVTLDQAAERFLSSKGVSTEKAYRVCLKRFALFYGKGLSEYIAEIEKQGRENEGKSLVDRARPGEDTARSFINWLKVEHGYANKSAIQAMAAVQNALKFYGLSLTWSFIEMPPNRPMKQNEKHAWTLDEMRQLVDAAEYLRDKTMILVAFQSGLGVSDLVSLNYGDIRRELEAGILPLMVKLYRQKSGVEFRTFIGRDAVCMVREYLKSRKAITDDAPLFTMLGSERRVTKHAFQKQLRMIAPKLPFLLDTGDLDNGEGSYNPARPHSLRSAFRSRLTGKMADTLIEFMLGHNIGEEKRAYLNMPADELREIYASYEHLLVIEKTSKEEAMGKQSPPLPPEVTARISKLETGIIGLTERNAELEAKNERQDEINKTLIEEVAAIKKLLTQK